jgi:hypothetical protein
MKIFIKYTGIISAVVLSAVMGVSCTKTFNEKVVSQSNFNNSSLVQVYMAVVSATRNYVYVDGVPVTGAALVLGSVFPGTGYGFNVPGGLNPFLVRDTLGSSTQTPLSFSENLEAGKKYTIFVYDTINSVKQKTVLTEIEIPADTTARLRFANFIFSKTAVPAVDIFSKRQNINLFTNVPITDVTPFIPIPSAFVDTFYVRETGTSNQLAVYNGFNPVEKRSYTLVFRGRYLTTSGTIARTLSIFSNR